MRREGSDRALLVDPGDEAPRLQTAIARAGRRARGDPAHPHALRPHRRRRADRARHRRAGLLPGARDARPRRHHGYVLPAGFGPFESWDAEQPSTAASACSSRASTSTSSSRPATAPATSPSRSTAGAVLRRRAVPGLDRPHRPARRRPRDAAGLDRRRCSSATTTTRGPPRSHGAHDARPRARDATRSCRRSRSGEREAPGAARHVRRAARRRPSRARALEDAARADPRARRLPAHRDADLRGHRALRPRRRRVDRHRPEGDVHLPGRRRALADAAPRGHRAGRAAPTSSTACTSSPSR